MTERTYVVNLRSCVVHGPKPGERCNTDDAPAKVRLTGKEIIERADRGDPMRLCNWCWDGITLVDAVQ